MIRNASGILASALLLIVAGQSGCGHDSFNDHLRMSLKITSPDFQQGGDIPKQFTCGGAGLSPALSCQSPPPNTKSLALIVIDSDSPFGYNFVHWLLYNLPPQSSNLAEGLPHQQSLPDGSQQGINGYDQIGYVPPCPPGKSPHRYVFTLYALDTKLALPPNVHKKQLTNAMEGHVLAAGQLMGRYRR